MRMRRQLVSILWFSALHCIAVEVHAQQELRWRLTPGEIVHYTHESRQVSRLGDDPDVLTTRVEDLTWRVERRELDGSARITQTIDRIRGNMPPSKDQQGPHEAFSYDTDQDPADGSVQARFLRTCKPLIGTE